MIYAAFATGGVNGWHYWWTQQFVPNASSPPPQYYALGNFSKFVRPGYYRVDVSGAPKPSGTSPLVIAFSSKKDATVAVVVVNGGSARDVSMFVNGNAWPASVTPLRDNHELQTGGCHRHQRDRRTFYGLARRTIGHDVRRKTVSVTGSKATPVGVNAGVAP